MGFDFIYCILYILGGWVVNKIIIKSSLNFDIIILAIN